MRWNVQCFAGLRDKTGRPELELDLPDGATAADVKAAVEVEFPSLRGRMGAVRVAAGYEFLDDADPLPAGEELALIPPVSGGAPDPPDPEDVDRIEITGDRLSIDRAVDFVRGPDAGAIVVFLGTVRAESRGAEVRHLDYEAYAAMAGDRLARIARGARETCGAVRVAVLHRTGRVEIGEESVVIAAAAPHRDAAFAAGRQVIEALKADVPIWKKEVYIDGATWVGWGS